MAYKGNKKDLFSQIFYAHLETALLQSNAIKGVEYTPRELKGYINKLIDVFSKVNASDGKYHIYASELANLSRNKLADVFKVFERAKDSTYHRNSSTRGNNGYTHSYEIKDWFLKLADQSFKDTRDHIKANKKYEKSIKEIKAKIKEIKAHNSSKGTGVPIQSVDDYLVIEKSKFLTLFSRFEKGKFDYFKKYLENVFYYDDQYVYVDNDLHSKKIDKYEGMGRSYTVLSNTSKDVRKYIFKGHTEVDINSCGPMILANLWLYDLQRKDNKNDLQELKDYHFENMYRLLTDKQGFRQKYANILGVKQNTIKSVITHLLYEPDSRQITHHFTEQEIKAASKKFLSTYELANPKKGVMFGGFVNELRMMRHDVVETYYKDSLFSDSINKHQLNELAIKDIKHYVDKWFVNDALVKKGKGSKKKESTIVHKIIELVEHQIRALVLDFISSKIETSVYQIHDAFIFNGSIQLDELERHIYDEIGFVAKFSEETY